MKISLAPSFFESLKRLDKFSISDTYYKICGWFKYHFNKDNWNLMKICWKGRPWQESFLYELEKAKITEMMNYIKKTQRFIGWEYVVRDMQICLNLIDIFASDGTKFFHYTGDWEFKPIEGSNLVELAGNFDYHCDIKVNTKNIKRFLKDNPRIDYWIEHPHELYILKAKYLYHKIRLERDNEWWD